MSSFKIILIMAFAAAACFGAVVKSPDGKIALTFALRDSSSQKGEPVYCVSYNGERLVAESGLGFELADGSALSSGFKVVSIKTAQHNDIWKPVYGERSSVRDNYKQLFVMLSRSETPACEMQLIFRCYNEGAALQYKIIKCGSSDKIGIKSENTEFNFLKDHVAWCVKTAQGKYTRKTISTMGTEIERPLTLETDGGICVAVGEADLVDYARMKLSRDKDDELSIVSHLSSSVEAALPLTTPWRVIMIADSPGGLLENNDLLLNLSDPCAIKDTSWIKPGKVIREVTLTSKGGKACIDFAVKHNLQFIEFDAGWYGNEYEDKSDASTITVDPKRSPGPLDLIDVIQYGKERGVGVILYVNRRALEKQLDQILPLYKKWGVAGLKYGFVNVGPQKWTSWMHDAIRKAADHKIMVDVHDEYRPTGYSRTYPNFMTQEGIGGDETSPSNEQTLSILFTRMLCGAGDNTICYYNSRVDQNATHAYQLAKAVCIYSPWQFLFWYDRPAASHTTKGGAGGQKGAIGDEPELEFYDHVPTVWDDTKVVHGSIGEYAVIARCSGSEWFIGGMNSGEVRSLKVPLKFLKPGKKYTAYIYYDDPSVKTRTHVGIKKQSVTSDSVLDFAMGEQGGMAVRIVPAG
jgi:alpha-glucosidase